jgi:hypothetical protein
VTTVDPVHAAIAEALPAAAPEVRAAWASAALLTPVVRRLVAEELFLAAAAMEAQVDQPESEWGRGMLTAAEQLRGRADDLDPPAQDPREPAAPR